MDKYEFNIKLEQIKKLVGKKDFKTASKIAKAMDFRKVKDWTTLALMINVQEAVGDFDEARDIAILAYNRNLGGRRLVYKLADLFIKLGELDDAESLYKEYARISQHDVNKYILLYNLRKAQNVGDERLIEILEEYKDHELDDKYLCELADLYSKTGRVEECLKECEEIALWFQEGIYVEKALRIKQRHTQLTTAQQKVLDNVGKEQKIDTEALRQLIFAEAKQKARLMEDEIEAVFQEEDETNSYIQNMNNNLDISGEARDSVNKMLHEDDFSVNGLSYDLEEENEDMDDSQDTVLRDREIGMQRDLDDNADEHDLDIEAPELLENVIKMDYSLTKASSEGLAKAGQSLRELIENAKKKIESNYQQVKDDDENEQLQEQIDNLKVPIANFNLYDTQNIQNEIAKNLDELIKENPDEDIFTTYSSFISHDASVNVSSDTQNNSSTQEAPEIEEEDAQIEGQLSLADWVEAIQEEKYGKQNTKEFSKAELDKLLEEREYEKEEYERLLEKQKKLAEDNGEIFNEQLARKHAQDQVILQSAKNDLAIRTGKATAKIEAEVENIREAAKLTAQIKERAAKEAERISNEVKLEAQFAEQLKVVHQDVFRDIFDEAEDDDNEEIDQVQNHEQNVEELPQKLDETAATDTEYLDSDNQEQQEALEEMIEEEYVPEESDVEEVNIPKSVQKYFNKYRDIPGLEDQLAHYFSTSKEENLMKTSESGNIIISGNRSSDKTSLAINIVKALNVLYPESPRKIAKTTGESINHKGIAKAMAKLSGTALIVEDAGVIEPKRISEMLSVMEKDTEGMIVIFEDADTEINVLLSVNPGVQKKFNHRIALKQYTVNELVEMAKKYASKRQHVIDDNALLQLYLKIDRLHAQVDYVRLDQIKEVIDRAILKAEKRASKKLFGIKKRRSNNGNVFFLTEVDFKD